ncbi:MAG: glycosyltransferase family 2 protein [Candidatus Omnitrophica bacterium]|nr:glycosyltransferase family 2 protein [Candidatus Omnitrophota bacterium]
MEELSISFVMPVYNEEAGIRNAIQRTLAVCASIRKEVPGLKEVEFVVVNDGSTDKTREIAGTFREIRLLNHTHNRGYGAALKTGFAASRGTFIAFLDADGTYPPEQIPRLLRTALETNADMALGSRFLGEKLRMPWLRQFGNHALAALLSWISGRKVTDTASGMRVFKRDILKTLHPLPDDLNLTPAMSTLAVHQRMKIIEVPIPYADRVGTSKLNLFRDGFRFLTTILYITQFYNPLRFYGTVGSMLLLGGLLLGVGPLGHYVLYREIPDAQIHRLIAVLVLAVSGLNAIIFGMSTNYVLAVIRGYPLPWFTPTKRFPWRAYLAVLGFILMCASILLYTRPLIGYLLRRPVVLHWSYTLTSAFLFLIGTQLVASCSLISIFHALRAQTLLQNAKQTESSLHDG